LKLRALSQGTGPQQWYEPFPVCPWVQLDFAGPAADMLCFRVEPIDDAEYTTRISAWMTYWGIVSFDSHVAVLRFGVYGYGETFQESEVVYGWVRDPPETGTWVYYGPVGGDQSVDSFDLAWSVAMTDLNLLAESSSAPPSYRARQDFSDDKVTYGGWRAGGGNCAYVFGAFSGNAAMGSGDVNVTMGIQLSNNSSHFYMGQMGITGLNIKHIILDDLRAQGQVWPLLDQTHLCCLQWYTGWANYEDGDTPAGTRYVIDGEGDALSFERVGDYHGPIVNEESIHWNGVAYAPYQLKFTWRPRNFDSSEGKTSPRLDCCLRDGTPAQNPRYLDPGETFGWNIPSYSWHDPKWRYISALALTAHCVEADLDATDENPQTTKGGEGGPPEVTYHDRRCQLNAWPLPETDYDNEPFWNGGALVLGHAASTNLNVPPGLGARPSLWTAVSGAAVDPGDNDLWTIQAANATIRRDLTKRYYTQMDQLQGGVPEGWAYEPGWPIWLKANLTQIDVSGDDEETQALLTADEDVFNWSNFGYTRINLPGTYNGKFKVVVTYSLVDYHDPKYTSGQRWIDWVWHRHGPYTVTYAKDRDGKPLTLTDSLRQCDLDLCCPSEGEIPLLAWVDRVEVVFLDDPGGDKTVTLDTWQLMLSDREGEEHHFLFGSKQAWDFFMSNYFGVGWVSDGLAQAQWDWYGDHRYVNEPGLNYIEHIEHDPEYQGDFYDLSEAKSLEQLMVEVALQEGLTAEYDQDAVDAQTMDAEENVLGSPVWWWIRRDADREPEVNPLDLGIGCGTLDIEHARGVPMTIIVEKNFSGKPSGIAKTGSTRARNATSGVRIYWKDDPAEQTTWALLGDVGTDAHGRYKGPPCMEDGGARSHADDRSREYRVGSTDEIGEAVNRSYWIRAATIWGFIILRLLKAKDSREWLFWSQANEYTKHVCAGPLTQWFLSNADLGYTIPNDDTNDSGSPATILNLRNQIILFTVDETTANRLKRRISIDDGETWTEEEVSAVASLKYLTAFPNVAGANIIYYAGVTDDGQLIGLTSFDGGVTLSSPAVITTDLDEQVPAGTQDPYSGTIRIYVIKGDKLQCWSNPPGTTEWTMSEKEVVV